MAWRARAAPSGRGAEEVREQRGRRLLELIVAAVGGRSVRAPAHEGGGVAESVVLEVVEGDLADELGPHRLPGEILAAVPARLRAGQAPALLDRGSLGDRPVPPRMILDAGSIGFEKLHQLRTTGHGERRGHTDRLEEAGIVEE